MADGLNPSGIDVCGADQQSDRETAHDPTDLFAKELRRSVYIVDIDKNPRLDLVAIKSGLIVSQSESLNVSDDRMLCDDSRR